MITYGATASVSYCHVIEMPGGEAAWGIHFHHFHLIHIESMTAIKNCISFKVKEWLLFCFELMKV